jgi:hypothetical protein
MNTNPTLLATPIDPLFLLLPVLASDGDATSTEYLASSDFLARMVEASPHLAAVLRLGKLEKMLEGRIEAVCDGLELGEQEEEKMYALSLPKLVKEIVEKARRMASKPLPKSLEDKFIKGQLEIPVASIRREESGVGVHGDSVAPGAVIEEDESSQDSNISGTPTAASAETAATSTCIPEQQQQKKDAEITHLLRLRTSLDFIRNSYLPSSLSQKLDPLIGTSIDWTPLTVHLAKVTAMKKEAQQMRSIGENISRKRVLGEDEEGREEIKKRKKEEEDRRKKGVSQGVRKLAKVDRSGMKSLSSFFGKK